MSLKITIGSQVIPQINNTKYLGSKIQENGKFDEEVLHCIKDVVLDKKIHLRL